MPKWLLYLLWVLAISPALGAGCGVTVALVDVVRHGGPVGFVVEGGLQLGFVLGYVVGFGTFLLLRRYSLTALILSVYALPLAVCVAIGMVSSSSNPILSLYCASFLILVISVTMYARPVPASDGSVEDDN